MIRDAIAIPTDLFDKAFDRGMNCTEIMRGIHAAMDTLCEEKPLPNDLNENERFIVDYIEEVTFVAEKEEAWNKEEAWYED